MPLPIITGQETITGQVSGEGTGPRKDLSGQKKETVSGSARGQRVCIITYGCAHNQSDSEHMAGQLAASGFALTDDPEEADLLVINSCTVKGPSQESFFSVVRAWRGKKPIIAAGCIPQADRENARLTGLSLLGVQQLDRITEVAMAALRGETIVTLGKEHVPSLSLPKRRKNRFIEIIPISIGCLHACAYCKTKHARGHLRSYAPAEIIARVKRAIAEGVLEIWLTGEDAGAYGRDIGTTLCELLEALVPRIPAPVMLRVGMMNPTHMKEDAQRLARVLRSPRVFSFLHIPVQSGSDSVLCAMRRDHTVAEFQAIVDTVRSLAVGVTVATDIICGYPTETAADFEATMAIVERNAFPVMNISKFYPRPGTPAARLPLLPTQEVKARSSRLTLLFRSQRPYDALVGSAQRVWVTAVSEDGRHYVGHTKAYTQALLARAQDGSDDGATLGRAVETMIVAAGKHSLRAELVR